MFGSNICLLNTSIASNGNTSNNIGLQKFIQKAEEACNAFSVQVRNLKESPDAKLDQETFNKLATLMDPFLFLRRQYKAQFDSFFEAARSTEFKGTVWSIGASVPAIEIATQNAKMCKFMVLSVNALAGNTKKEDMVSKLNEFCKNFWGCPR